MTKNVFIFTPHYLLLCDISLHAISHWGMQRSPSNIPALGLKSVWQAPLSVGGEILLSQLCSFNDSFWLSSSGGVAWALSFLTVLQFYSGSQMSQGQERSSLMGKGRGFELRRWVATAAVDKDKNTKCHHNLFLIRGSRMPLKCWGDCGLATFLHLNPAHSCSQPREAGVVRMILLSSEDGGQAPLWSAGRTVTHRSGWERAAWYKKISKAT